MNTREKILAVSISLLLVVVGGYFLFEALEQGLSARGEQIVKLKAESDRLQGDIAKAERADARWKAYREQSLPADRELARSLYQKWLLKEIDAVGMSSVTINGVPATSRGDALHLHAFKVTCKGNIEQLTKWLHQFYSVDMLHRLRQLTVKPQSDSKLLDLSISLEAVSLVDADVEELPTRASDRLQHDGIAPYVEAIIGRNLFASANQPPKFAALGTQRGNPRRPLTFAAKADDPDKLDQVTFQLVEPELTGAKLDSRSGAFQWTPSDKGEFEITIEAKDNGFPAKASRQKIRLVIADPPPPPDPVVEKPTKKKLDFDPARHTILTGIIGNDANREIWLTIRTTGEIQKLHVGDRVNIGSIEGKVLDISANSFELQTDEKRYLVNLGDPLLLGRDVASPSTSPR